MKHLTPLPRTRISTRYILHLLLGLGYQQDTPHLLLVQGYQQDTHHTPYTLCVEVPNGNLLAVRIALC
jgi:hypothetical protein